MTDESYLRGLSDEKLYLEYSTWITHKGKRSWNSRIMEELRRRGRIRRAKEFHELRMRGIENFGKIMHSAFR